MSITDELREWMRVVLTDDDPAHAIADRIDERVKNIRFNEHHKGYQDGIMDGCSHYDPEHTECMVLEEHAYIKLPVDADGEVIHIGDRVENNERVVRIVLTDGSWEPSVYVEKLPNVLHEYFCNEISHYHEPTVEDVLREFFSRYVRYVKTNPKEEDDAIIAEYAAKLRLAGDAE